MKRELLSRRGLLTAAAGVSAAAGGHPANQAAAAKGAGARRGLGTLDRAAFLNPGAENRGVPLFFLNDKLDGAEAVRQIREMRYAGWGRVLPRRYSGLLDATYGKRWNQVLHEIVAASKKIGFTVFLQEADKNGWYTAAPTQLPGMKDEYRNKCLVRRPAGAQPEEHEVLVTRAGGHAYYQRSAYPKAGWENSFCWLDLLDEDVVRNYLTALFTFLDREFGAEFGRTIEALWVAEPHITMGEPKGVPFVPWTTRLPAVFQKQWGYPLLDNIGKLFEKEGDYQTVRYHFWRTLGDRLAECYSKVTAECCRRYKLKFTGHLMGEDTFSAQLQYSVNVMPLLEYMDIPGIDHLTLDLYWPTGDPFIFTPKQVSSVANQLGKREVLSEMYGTADLGCSFEDQKRVFEWLAALGINYRNYHGSFYSLRGHRKRNYPPNLNLQQPYWPESRLISDYCARLSYALQQGRFAADVLVINSIESGYLEGHPPRREFGPLDRDLLNLSQNLLKLHRGFDYGDETLMAKHGKVSGGRLHVGEMAYRVVVLPRILTLRNSTFALLSKFQDAGGTIVSVGELPTRIDGRLDGRIDTLNKRVLSARNEPDSLRETLDRLAPPGFRIRYTDGASTGPVWAHERLLDDGSLLFLVNTSAESGASATLSAAGAGFEKWNLEDGQVESLPQQREGEHITTAIELAPCGSCLLRLNPKASPAGAPAVRRKVVSEIPLERFQVVRHEPNAFTLDFCRFRRDTGEWSQILPVQGVQQILSDGKYSGPVTLRFAFPSEIAPRQCSVVVEEADKYSIRVNENSVKHAPGGFYRDRCFLPVEITEYVRPGVNRIDIARPFEAPDRRFVDDDEKLHRYYGTELEQVYLTGEFAVRGERIGSDYFETERHRYRPRFVMTGETGVSSGDLLADGYPFFNGTISLVSHVEIAGVRRDRRYFLKLGRLGATVAEVRVNGREAGKIAWQPYSVDITHLVWKGENRIEIRLTNSLRNLLGGLHFVPLKDVKGQWSLKAEPRLMNGARWYENREKNKTWSDDYFLRPLGAFEARIVCEE